jgi:hypothetical protein
VEIVIAVNPVHISTIENTCNHVAVDQQMVAAGAWAGIGRRIVAESCMDR